MTECGRFVYDEKKKNYIDWNCSAAHFGYGGMWKEQRNGQRNFGIHGR